MSTIEQSKAYTELLMEETEAERSWKDDIVNDKMIGQEEKKKILKKLEEDFWYRRLINAYYFKQLKNLVLSGNYK